MHVFSRRAHDVKTEDAKSKCVDQFSKALAVHEEWVYVGTGSHAIVRLKTSRETSAHTYVNLPAGSRCYAIAFDRRRRMWIACNNHCIYRVDEKRQPSLMAGKPNTKGVPWRTHLDQRFNAPRDIAFDSQDRLVICDTGNDAVCRLDAKGHTEVLGGGPDTEEGRMTEGRLAFSQPRAIVVATLRDDCIYVADTNNQRIRTIERNGSVRTIAGRKHHTPMCANTDGVGKAALFDYPHRLVFNTQQTMLYVACASNIRLLHLKDSSVSTLDTSSWGAFYIQGDMQMCGQSNGHTFQLTLTDLNAKTLVAFDTFTIDDTIQAIRAADSILDAFPPGLLPLVVAYVYI